MTTAETLAARFHNDGSTWEDAEGVRLTDAIDEYPHQQHEFGGDQCVVEFADGSAIGQAGGLWDLVARCGRGWASIDRSGVLRPDLWSFGDTTAEEACGA